jgi:hypothetical protein
MPGVRTGGPLGLSDTRNDLLFTMSDTTHLVAARMIAHASISAMKSEFVFSSDDANSSRIQIPTGGARRDRTDDLLLAKQALSQLSYGPRSRSLPAFNLRPAHEPKP